MVSSCEKKNCCADKKKLDQFDIESIDFINLKTMFKTLSNETRLRLLYQLALNKEMCVSEIASAIKMKHQAVSNQLQLLIHKGVIKLRRNGNHLYYSIKDSCMINLLEQAICMNQKNCPRSLYGMAACTMVQSN